MSIYHEFKCCFLRLTQLGERIHVKVKLKDNHKVIVQGEEYSVSPQNYWIRARTLNDEEDVKAVLHYDNAVGEPKTLPRICTEETPCKYYNWYATSKIIKQVFKTHKDFSFSALMMTHTIHIDMWIA